jgi:hypothetical protein
MPSGTTLLNFADEIKIDHDNVRDLMQRCVPNRMCNAGDIYSAVQCRFKAATSQDEKAAIANTMIREMAIHSDAELVIDLMLL